MTTAPSIEVDATPQVEKGSADLDAFERLDVIRLTVHRTDQGDLPHLTQTDVSPSRCSRHDALPVSTTKYEFGAGRHMSDRDRQSKVVEFHSTTRLTASRIIAMSTLRLQARA